MTTLCTVSWSCTLCSWWVMLWQLYVQSLGVVLYVTGEFVLWQLCVQSLGVVLYVTGEFVLWQLYVQSLGVVLYVTDELCVVTTLCTESGSCTLCYRWICVVTTLCTESGSCTLCYWWICVVTTLCTESGSCTLCSCVRRSAIRWWNATHPTRSCYIWPFPYPVLYVYRYYCCLSQQHIHNISVIKISPRTTFNYIQVKTPVYRSDCQICFSLTKTENNILAKYYSRI